MTKQPIVKRSVGFYLIEGFWAGAKPDYTKFSSQYWIKPEYWKIMEEIVLTFEHDGRTIDIARDGLISYSDDELSTQDATGETFKRIEKYTEILNGIFSIFVSVITSSGKIKYHTNFEVTHHDIVPITYVDGKQVSMGWPQKSITNSQLDKRMLNNVPSGYEDSLDHWIDSPPRAIVSLDALKEACRTYFEIAEDKESIRLLARSNKAASEFASTSFSDCILACWIQVEVYLYQKLSTYMDSEGVTKFNQSRKNKLLKSTSSQMIEILEISGQLTKDNYDLLSKVRRVRNEIVHKSYSASIEEASDALRLLELVIKEKAGETVVLNNGITMSLF